MAWIPAKSVVPVSKIRSDYQRKAIVGRDGRTERRAECIALKIPESAGHAIEQHVCRVRERTRVYKEMGNRLSEQGETDAGKQIIRTRGNREEKTEQRTEQRNPERRNRTEQK